MLKKAIHYFFFLFPAILLSVKAYAQVPEDSRKENILEQKIETLAEDAEDTEIDFTLIFDELLYYVEHPINLNRTNRDELHNLHVLNDFQINNLFIHIENYGKLMTIYELQAIPGFDLQTIQRLIPFVKVSADIDAPRLTFKEMMKNGQHQLIARHHVVLEDQKGYMPIDDSTLAANPNARYLGSQERIYARYRFNYGNKISWGFTAEKDPGEEFFRGTQKQGFDFYTGHLFIRNFGKIKALAIGDFQAQFGQGLTFWSGLAFGKSSFVMNIKRNPGGLRPSGSVDENRFMRGAGITLGFGNFEFTAFGSHKRIDANTITLMDTVEIGDEIIIFEDQVITSFQTSGLHRTPRELERRNTLSETIYGGRAAYRKRNINIGIIAARNEFGGILQRNLTFYNQFEFNENKNTNLGVDYNYIFRNINFFGEVARSENGAIAYVNGLLMSVDPKLSVVLHQRNYTKDYQSVYSAALAENTRNANEQAVYIGMNFLPVQKVSLNAYYDRFVFPWMRFQVDAPSHGTDVLVQMNYAPSKKTDIYIRFRQRDRFRNSPENIDDIDPIVGTLQSNYRFNIAYQLTPVIRMRSRVEWIEYQIGERPRESGYLMYQDLIYKSMKSPFQFNLRYALFDTDSWNTRIYTYESDVLYAFSIPPFYLRGSRVYAMVRYIFKRNIDLWVRYSQTYYYNRNVIGTGLEEIQGNTRSELKVQLRYRF
jgi:hypothetical protein